MGVPWFSNLPAELAKIIMRILKAAVPEKAQILRDIFDEKVPEEKPDVEELVPECDADCSGFGFFKMGGAGGTEVKQGDAEAAKKIAEFDEKLSEEQKKDLLEEAERRGMLDKPFDEQQAQQLLKELEAKRKKQPQPEAPQEPQEPQEPQGQQPKTPPKTAEQKRREKQAREAEKAGPKSPPAKQRPDIADPKKQQGQGQTEAGACTWQPNMLDVHGWILELLDPTSGLDAGHNILKFGTSAAPFDKQPIVRDCVVNLAVKNDFKMGDTCYREGEFTPPVVSTEISFNNEVLFKQTDNKPLTGYVNVPKWGHFIILKSIRKSGNLQIKITMKDSDTGTVKMLVENVTIDIVTKDKCCDCIS